MLGPRGSGSEHPCELQQPSCAVGAAEELRTQIFGRVVHRPPLKHVLRASCSVINPPEACDQRRVMADPGLEHLLDIACTCCCPISACGSGSTCVGMLRRRLRVPPCVTLEARFLSCCVSRHRVGRPSPTLVDAACSGRRSECPCLQAEMKRCMNTALRAMRRLMSDARDTQGSDGVGQLKLGEAAKHHM